MLDIFQRSIGPLRAEEMLQEATVVRSAGSKQEDFAKFIRRLSNMAEPDTPEPPAPLVKPEHAAWFEREGIPHRLH